MQRYIVHRFLQGILALFFLLTMVFILSRLTGNPLDLMLPVEISPEARAQMAKNLGLDRPYHEQYFIFLSNAVKGDFGNSMIYHIPNLGLFLDRFANSIVLIFLSFIMAIFLGTILGVLGAVFRGRFIGQACGVIGVAGIALPPFWIGLMSVLVFAVVLRILPAGGMGGPSHYILPVVGLSFYLVAGMMRLIRSSMLETMGTEFIKLARIKGLSENTVMLRHCLRNSLISGTSFIGMYFGHIITGAIVIEVVFAWPGAGRLLYSAIITRDYPLLQTVIVMKGILILAVTLLVDVLYAYLDPRIRY